MEWIYDDGGRAEAGFKGVTGDCVCRAVAIAAERPYKEVYDLINEYAQAERKCKHKKSNARTGVRKTTTKKVLEHYGFKWVPTMQVGSGCKVHLKSEELPKGRIVCQCSAHCVAVIDGKVHDTYDSTREESRCVYGYYYKPDNAGDKNSTVKEKEKAKKEKAEKPESPEKKVKKEKPMAEEIRGSFAELKEQIKPADYPEAIKAINGLIDDFEKNAKNNNSLYELRKDKESHWRSLVWAEAAKELRECVKDLENNKES